MALPRQAILNALKAKLAAISQENGASCDVKTVAINPAIESITNRSAYPMIGIFPGIDTGDRETQGGVTANRYHRSWPIKIQGAFWPRPHSQGKPEDVLERGEDLIGDIVRALTLDKTFGLGNQAGIIGGFSLGEILAPDQLSAVETGQAAVEVNVIVWYEFRPDSI